MAKKLTKKERIKRTFAFQETDRVPIYDILFCNSAIEYFSGEKLPCLKENAETREIVDRITGKAINKFLDMTRASGFGPLEDRDYTDEFGFLIHVSAYSKTSWIVKRPFSDETGAAEYIKKIISNLNKETKEIIVNPREYRDNFHRSFRQHVSNIGDTMHLLTNHGTGLDDISAKLGLEIFSYLQVDNSGLLSELYETWTNHNIAVCHSIADLSLSSAVLTYGDIACKNSLIYSPDYLRKEFFPRLKRLNDAWHEHGFKCLFHSDGYLMDVMDDLIVAGIDGLNPIETVAGMSLKEIRKKYGNKIFLAGGIDISQLLSNGTPEEVREVCRQAIRDAYPGYFIGSTTEMDNSAKLENIIAMYEEVYKQK